MWPAGLKPPRPVAALYLTSVELDLIGHVYRITVLSTSAIALKSNQNAKATT